MSESPNQGNRNWPKWQDTLANTLGPEQQTNNAQTGIDPNLPSPGPVLTMRIPSGKEIPSQNEQPRSETPRPIDAPPSLNIEDRDLPGNVGWMSRVANAYHGRTAKILAEITTLPDRVMAGSWARTEERAQTRASTLNQQRQEQMMKKMEAQAKIQELRFSNHWSNRIPFVRWINEQRAAWHRTKSDWAEARINSYDGKIREATHIRDNAKQQQSIYGSQIEMKVNARETVLNDKLRPIEGLRKEAEDAVDRLSERATHFAQLVETKKEQIEQLMALRMSDSEETDSQRTERDALMNQIHEQRIRAEQILKQTENKLQRVYHHQSRIGRAHAVLTGAKENIEARYLRSIARASHTEGSTTPAAIEPKDDTASTIAELVQTVSGERGMEKELNTQQFIRLWNRVAAGAPIKSLEQLTRWWDGARERFGITTNAPTPPEQALFESARQDKAIKLNDWKIIINRLVRYSPEFKTHLAKETSIETTNDAFELMSMLAAEEDYE